MSGAKARTMQSVGVLESSHASYYFVVAPFVERIGPSATYAIAKRGTWIDATCASRYLARDAVRRVTGVPEDGGYVAV